MISVATYTRLAIVTTLLAALVITFGAYVRLSNAGLSCPDWPGCYGQVLVPQTQPAIDAANMAYPTKPVDVGRAWKEMVHRYLAGFLGLMILALALLAWRRRKRPGQLLAIPITLVALVTFQGLLGMWTVTLLLKPLIVTAHLVGGLATLSLLWWLSLRQGRLFLLPNSITGQSTDAKFQLWILLGLVLLGCQILLGGWTSTNYAALACPDFPTCQGAWLPPLDLIEAFDPWRGLGQNYEGGVLDNTARVSIHYLHRIGAIVVTLYFVWLCHRLSNAETPVLKTGALLLFFALGIQVALGISNVILYLPLEIAVAHNGGAALLLLATLTVYHMARPPTSVAI